MSWTQTRKGRVFDLAAPVAEMVDFSEIAETLAFNYRYCGGFEKPISVAQHSLIAFEAAEPRDRAATLLHDAHEAFIGDITTPTVQQLQQTIHAQSGDDAADAFRRGLLTLKYNIDLAIYAAAGLPMPDFAQCRRIRIADLTALATERRDFLARSPKPWAEEVEAAKPSRKIYRYRTPMDAADDLYRQFKLHLPALSKNAA